MPQRIPRRSLLATGAAGLAGLAGCSSLPGMGGDDGDGGGTRTDNPMGFEMQVGMVLPTEGPMARFGESMQAARDLAVEQVEAMPTEHSLDMPVRETDGTPASAVEQTRALKDEGYPAVVGPASDEATIEVANQVLVVPDNPMLGISPYAASEDILNLEDRVPHPDLSDDVQMLFTGAPGSKPLGANIATPLAQAQIDTVSIIYEDTLYGQDVMAQTKSEINTRGLTEVVTEVELTNAGTDDYSAKIEEAMADDPTGVVLIANPPTGISVLEDYYGAEYGSTPIFMSDRLQWPGLVEETPIQRDNAAVVGPVPSWHNDNQGDENTTAIVPNTVAAPFLQAWLFKYGEWPVVQDAIAYDCILTMVMASIGAGPNNYESGIIADEIAFTVNRQKSRSELPAGVDSTNFFERNAEDEPWVGPMVDGLFNDYTGPTGSVNYSTKTGAMIHTDLRMWQWTEENFWGLEFFDPFDFVSA